MHSLCQPLRRRMASPRPVQRQQPDRRCRQMWVTDGGVEGMTADGMMFWHPCPHFLLLKCSLWPMPRSL